MTDQQTSKYGTGVVGSDLDAVLADNRLVVIRETMYGSEATTLQGMVADLRSGGYGPRSIGNAIDEVQLGGKVVTYVARASYKAQA